MGFGLDLFKQVTNVSWGSGLAVEFPPPGHLHLLPTLNLGKATISFWFIVPQSSLDAAQSKRIALNEVLGANVDWRFDVSVPLLSWGATGMIENFFIFPDAGYASSIVGPSCISIQTEFESSNKKAHLEIWFQSNNSCRQNLPEGTLHRFDNYFVINNYSDASSYMAVSADEWHHLIVSFDISGPRGKLWVALDDKNYDGSSFLPAGGNPISGGPNNIVAQGEFETEPPTSNGGFSHVDSPFGVPVASGYTSYSYTVDLAELQIFTGITLDTNKETNRRAFLDFKRDSDGNIISDENGKKTMQPVDPKKAEELMEKRPEVLLHGINNWKNGKNTGSLGVDEDGHEIETGWFSPTDPIDKYTPGPSLTKES